MQTLLLLLKNNPKTNKKLGFFAKWNPNPKNKKNTTVLTETCRNGDLIPVIIERVELILNWIEFANEHIGKTTLLSIWLKQCRNRISDMSQSQLNYWIGWLSAIRKPLPPKSQAHKMNLWIHQFVWRPDVPPDQSMKTWIARYLFISFSKCVNLNRYS